MVATSRFEGLFIANDELSGDGVVRTSSSFSGCEKCVSHMVAGVRFGGFSISNVGMSGDGAA